MSAASYPVDSATRPCCTGIGAHTLDCPAPPEYVPPVECTPWCEYGDGHPTETCREDQTCWSPAAYVDLSLESASEDSDGDHHQRLGAMAYQDAGEEPGVYLHLFGIRIYGPIRWPYNYLDRGLRLTVEEADKLAVLLTDAASLARENTGVMKR